MKKVFVVLGVLELLLSFVFLLLYSSSLGSNLTHYDLHGEFNDFMFLWLLFFGSLLLGSALTLFVVAFAEEKKGEART